MNNLEMEGITPEYAIQLGKEWFESMVDATPDEELVSLPKFEHLLLQEHRDGEEKCEQKGKADMLARQLRCRFGDLPDWAREKIAKAEIPSLEEWSLRIFDAQSLDEALSN